MLSRVSWLSLFLGIGLLAGGQVWLAYLRVDVAQDIAKLKKEKILLVQDVQSLKLELASMKRPDTLRRLAREMGMAAPTAMQVVKP
jgi:cell division protein FtsL